MELLLFRNEQDSDHGAAMQLVARERLEMVSPSCCVARSIFFLFV
jgi:hypothetical protein